MRCKFTYFYLNRNNFKLLIIFATISVLKCRTNFIPQKASQCSRLNLTSSPISLSFLPDEMKESYRQLIAERLSLIS